MAEEILTVTFPDIGEGVVEGEVISWFKEVGDEVAKDEPVVSIMTDKATVELPSPRRGKLHKKYYKAGEIAQRDKPLYEIAFEGERSTKAAAVEKQSPPTVEGKIPPKVKSVDAVEREIEENDAIMALPAVRQLAKSMGIGLSAVTATGRGGRITVEDLRHYCQHRITGAIPPDRASFSRALLHLPDDDEEPLIGIRGAMAKKMAESKAHIPHFSYFEQVDVKRLIQLKGNVKRSADSEGIHLTFMPFIIRALSLCIEQYPILNSSYDEERKTQLIHHHNNIGIAVSTEKGLIVPVLKNVQEMSLEQVIRNYDALIIRAHQGELLPDDMRESTITISNYGSIAKGGLWATPIINYPEAAILAISRIHKEALPYHGDVALRDVINLSWSFDHRLIDGDTAANISDHLAALLQNPSSLL